MRTNIVIDDELMARAMDAAEAATKRETVETALRLLIAMKAQEGLRSLRGGLAWEGDLESMRLDG